MELESLRPAKGAVKKGRRVGRGPGSGRGKTSGRGHKGQKSRSGYSSRPGFEGGQMPLQRRLPKRGFTNIFRVERACINVRDLCRRFDAGSTVGPEDLRSSGLLKDVRDGVKVLGDGEVDRALTVRAHAFTRSAREKIEAAGGSCEVLEG
jgi:large subunit ribosomal protein L15